MDEKLRTSRSDGSTTYTYVYRGDKLSRMHVGSTTLTMSYDGTGTPFSVTYNGTTYYYATNLQRDVVAILNSAGASVVTYTYDAWGNHLTTAGTLSSTLGEANALRYRGYVFDSESGLYYLQSRYYDPALGRFINADAFTSTGQGLLGNNMFAYCRNNPVSRIDACGTIDTTFYGDGEILSNEELDARRNSGGAYHQSAYSKGFRGAVQRHTGESGTGKDAHHVFPQKFTKNFSDLGINNSNPEYGAWWESSAHRQASYEYNLWWDAFFQTPGVTADDAYALAELLSRIFGFDIGW